ncbi:baseplate assembly protein, partial [Edwardsiella anguillarum]
MGMMDALNRKVLNLIGRAVIQSISSASKCQTVDVSLIGG